MKINGTDYKVGVTLLTMEDEFPAARLAVASILNSIKDEAGVSVSVLLNGSNKAEIREYFGSLPGVSFYQSNENLGVAAGRNFLYCRPEIAGSDIILTLDNDIIVPNDYVRMLSTFLIEHPEAGVVGPAMLWASQVAPLLQVDVAGLISAGDNGNLPQMTCQDIKDYFVGSHVKRDKLYHLGSKHWFLSYGLNISWRLKPITRWLWKRGVLRKPLVFLVKDDHEMVRTIKHGAEKLDVANVPGGASAFRSELVRKEGLLEPAFSPWGYEDCEFAVRLIRAGYKNYITCDAWLLHGTDLRHHERDKLWKQFNRARIHLIFLRKIFKNPLVRIPLIAELVIWTLVSHHGYDRRDKTVTGYRLTLAGLKGLWAGMTAPISSNKGLARQAQEARAKAEGFESGETQPAVGERKREKVLI